MENTNTQKSSKGNFIKGAVWIATGGFLAKLIGALYRIPLTNLIGGYGMGLYQMVYPIYCLLLTVSATGIPSSISKLTAERIGKGESTQPLFKTAMRLFLIIGGVACVAGCVLSLISVGFIAFAKDPSKRRCGFVLACLTKGVVALFFLCLIIIRAEKGNYGQLWWMLPLVAAFLVMAVTDIALSKKLQLC